MPKHVLLEYANKEWESIDIKHIFVRKHWFWLTLDTINILSLVYSNLISMHE